MWKEKQTSGPSSQFSKSTKISKIKMTDRGGALWPLYQVLWWARALFKIATFEVDAPAIKAGTCTTKSKAKGQGFGAPGWFSQLSI